IDVISEIYENSEYQNLRHLKQSLWDFERFLRFVSKDALSKNDLLDHLMKIFLILSFEIKSGEILPKDISRFKSDYFSSILELGSKNKEDTPYQKVSKKYNNINLRNLLIEESIWIDFFDKGCCSIEKVQESLEKSEYYLSENTPNWVRLWHSMDLSDEEFDAALESVEKDFYEKVFSELGVIRHVAGTFLWLSKIGLIKKAKREILEFSCAYIDHLKDRGQLNTD
ncbi:hypothetical protein, partial [Brenneria goodwinii]